MGVWSWQSRPLMTRVLEMEIQICSKAHGCPPAGEVVFSRKAGGKKEVGSKENQVGKQEGDDHMVKVPL